jgi:hypothetical protein
MLSLPIRLGTNKNIFSFVRGTWTCSTTVEGIFEFLSSSLFCLFRRKKRDGNTKNYNPRTTKNKFVCRKRKTVFLCVSLPVQSFPELNVCIIAWLKRVSSILIMISINWNQVQPKEKNTKLIQLDSWTEPFWNVNDCSIFNSIKIQQLPSSNDNSDKIELFNLFLQEIQIKDYY